MNDNGIDSGIVTGFVCFLVTGDIYGSIAAGVVVMISSLIFKTG